MLHDKKRVERFNKNDVHCDCKSSLINKMHVLLSFKIFMYGLSGPYPKFSNLTNQISRMQMDIDPILNAH